MLGLAKRVNARIFQASTSEVYGDPLEHPQTERYWGHVNPLGERACYDEGKRCAETLFMEYRRRHHVPIKIARIFNTYGPRLNPADGRVVSNFITQALLGKPLSVYGDGSQTRAFCYVDDMIEAFVRLMSISDDITGPVNLGDPHEITILEIANLVQNLVAERTGLPASSIEYHRLPGDDPVQRNPDISVAHDLLDWHPSTSLRDGLMRTIDYIFDVLDSGSNSQRTFAGPDVRSQHRFTGQSGNPVSQH